ncbi:MAG TPA: hypothetical protein VNQ73_01185 [Ilumatobacter sp.]|nr:hypothetical protein [Ilumatobacter sp.]
MTTHRAPHRPKAHRRRLRCVDDDRGSIAAEAAVATTALVVLMSLVVYAGHTAEADGNVRRAASEAARAASLRQHPDAATAAAEQTVATNLAAAGIACDPLTVDIDLTNFTAGGTVAVEVTCATTLDAASTIGAPRHQTYHARSVEVIDTYRSELPTP